MSQNNIGRYQVLEEIASGGQGAVYRVFDPDTGQIVALKVLHVSLSTDSNYVERFRLEASLASSIDHPNVVKIFEVGQDGDQHPRCPQQVSPGGRAGPTEALEAEDEKDGGGQVGDRRDVGGAHDRFSRFEVNMASIRPVTRNPPTTLMVARTTATNPSVVVNVE